MSATCWPFLTGGLGYFKNLTGLLSRGRLHCGWKKSSTSEKKPDSAHSKDEKAPPPPPTWAVWPVALCHCWLAVDLRTPATSRRRYQLLVATKLVPDSSQTCNWESWKSSDMHRRLPFSIYIPQKHTYNTPIVTSNSLNHHYRFS